MTRNRKLEGLGAYQTIRDARAKASAGVNTLFGAVWILFLVSWSIYPLAYLMPQL